MAFLLPDYLGQSQVLNLSLPVLWKGSVPHLLLLAGAVCDTPKHLFVCHFVKLCGALENTEGCHNRVRECLNGVHNTVNTLCSRVT